MTFQSLYGTPGEDTPVNRDTALSIAAMEKGRNLITSLIGGMPLVAMKSGKPLELQPSLLTQLSPGTANYHTLVWIVDGMIFHGVSYLLITSRTADGKPASVQVVPHGEAETKDGVLIRAFGKPVRAQDSIRVDAHHEGVLKRKSTIRTALEIERASAEVGVNPVPQIVLNQIEGRDLRDDEIDGLLTRWRANRRKRGGSVGYLTKGIKAEALGQSAENLLINGLNWQVLQVARLLGLPAHILDGSVQGASLNYTNAASRNQELLAAVDPYIKAIEATFSLFMPHGTVVRFDRTELIRPDTKQRYDEYEVGLRAGFLTVSEVREREGLSPLPEPEPTTDLPTTEDTE
ncbi:phage portal protein [Cellulosimicrobium funkei]|nr:phage portal protein [Cellulosimicrobium funkei]